MTMLVIRDLKADKELDRDALAKLSGRGAENSSWSNHHSDWNASKRLSRQHVGKTYQDGYLVREFKAIVRKP